MFKKVFYAIVIAIIMFVVVGLFLPQAVHVERSIHIERPVATVFTVLNSYRQFADWSPWTERDPDAVYELSGPEAGPGARLSWVGDPRLVGTGWQEIVESQPWSLIRMQIDFDQQGVAESYFRLDPTKDGTLLTWGFDTDLLAGHGWFGGVLARYFGLFFDTWIGSDYEAGLARLKNYLESLPQTDFSDLEVELIEVQPVDILFVAGNSGTGPVDISASLAAAYQDITAFMAEHDIERTAQPMTITRIGTDGRYEIEAAIPVRLPEDLPPAPDSQVRAGHSPAGRSVRVVHRGAHDRMGPTYEKLAAWMAAHGLTEGRVSWEQYISDPGETPENELITHIYFRVADDG